MKCKTIQKKLIFLIEDELDKKESSVVKAHLDTCSDCRFLFNQLEQSLAFISNDKLTDTNPFFVTRVMESIRQKPTKNSIFGWLEQKQMVLQAAIYAFTISISLLAGIYLGSENTKQDDVTFINETEKTDYQLFADSYNNQFNKNEYLPETSNDEE